MSDSGWVALPHLLGNRRFGLVWFGQVISEFGDRIYFTALVVFVYELTRSGIDVGKVLATASLSSLLSALLAGALIDRIGPRQVLIGSNLCCAVIVALMLAVNKIWQVYVVAFALAAVVRVFNVAWNATLPAITDKTHLVLANALTGTTRRIAQIVGPLIGGSLASHGAARLAFGLNAGSFAIAALGAALAAIPAPHIATDQNSRTVRGYAAVWHALLADPYLALLGVALAVVGVLIGVNNTLIVVYTDEVLGLGAASFGVLVSALGTGMLLGAIITPRLVSVLAPAFVLNIGLAGLAGSLLGLSLVPIFPVTVAFRLLMGVSMSAFNVTVWSTLQGRSAETVRGRVLGLARTAEDAAIVMSMAASGFVATYLGVRSALGIGGLIGVVFAGVLMYRTPQPAFWLARVRNGKSEEVTSKGV